MLSEFDFLPGMSPVEMVTAPPAGEKPPKLFNELEDQLCYDLKVNGPATLDVLAARLAIAPGLIAGTLMALEIRDVVSKSNSNVYALK